MPSYKENASLFPPRPKVHIESGQAATKCIVWQNVKDFKVKGQDTRYSPACMSQTPEQQRFTISKMAADWHELMIPQCIMRPSIARANGQLGQRCS